MLMTTFVLHGGASSKESIYNNQFFGRFTSLVNKKSVRILFCYFAKEGKDWNEVLNNDLKRINNFSGDKKVLADIAADSKDLLIKLKKADVLYVAGGKSDPIENKLEDLKELKNELNGKVYIGSSMGAFIIAKKYFLSFEYQEPEIRSGLGILDLNVLCHWDIEKFKSKKLKRLRGGNNFPILLLDECESVVLSV